MPIAAQQENDLESSSWLWNTPCQWSPGWDWLLLHCSEWLRVGQARLLQWRGPAAIHWYPGPWFIWLQLRTWVKRWASSQHWRQASGPGKKNPAPRQVGPKQNLGRNTTWKFSKVEARAPFGWQTSINMTEDHVSSLFCCYLVCSITIKLNSISQSD